MPKRNLKKLPWATFNHLRTIENVQTNVTYGKPDPDRVIVWESDNGNQRIVAQWDVGRGVAPKVTLEDRMAANDAMNEPRWAPTQIPESLQKIYYEFIESLNLPEINIIKEEPYYDNPRMGGFPTYR